MGAAGATGARGKYHRRQLHHRLRSSSATTTARSRCEPLAFPNRSSSTDIWTKTPIRISPRSPASSSRSRTRGAGDREDRRVAVLRRRQHLRRRRAAGTRQPEREVANEMRRDGQSIARQRKLRRRVRHVPRSPQRLPLSDQRRSAGCATATSPTSATEPRLEHGLGRADGAVRGRLDRRDGRFRSSRCAIAPARRRSGASTSGAW